MLPIKRYVPDPDTYIGRVVCTTDERIGVVMEAELNDGGVVEMRAESDTGVQFLTDSEHATIVRER